MFAVVMRLFLVFVHRKRPFQSPLKGMYCNRLFDNPFYLPSPQST